jgi:murein DD-endopeptidase MepM/ murein hydrolase activator NlpD
VFSRIPDFTRILLIPSDDSRTTELTISRRLVIALGVLVLTILSVFVLLILSYATLLQRVDETPELRRQLGAVERQLVQVQDLNRELETMRELQEQVLTLLGVEPRAPVEGDEAVGGPGIVEAIMTPPPDRWPMRGYVTAEFEEGDPARGNQPHLGIDLTAPVGTPVRAAGRGLVQKAATDEYLGNYVEIRHGFGYVTVYAHCSSLAVQAGDRVDAGQIVATMGGTGKVTAPHLHFEVWKDDEPLNPRVVISGEPEGP